MTANVPSGQTWFDSVDPPGSQSQLPSSEERIDRRLALSTLTPGLLVAAVAFAVFALAPLPAEDAAMLFRYSENLASGYGIVFNPGGSPVDGATDLLFMIMIGGLHWVGIPTQVAAAFVNAVGLGLMTSLVYWSWRAWAHLRSLWSFLPVVILLVSPVWVYGTQGFGTVAFAAACTGVAFASEAVVRRPTVLALTGLGALVVTAGLIRPEGFILGALIVASQAWRTRSARALWIPGAVIAAGGLAFMAIRWSYFGYPLPNPLYKKSGGQLHLVGLSSTAAVLVRAGLPLCLLLVLGLTARNSRRRATSLILIILGWASAWLLISNETNTAGRFQYAILPALLVLSAPLYQEFMTQASGTRWAQLANGALAVVCVVGIIVSVLAYLLPTARTLVPQIASPDGARANAIHPRIADTLSRFAGDGDRVVATTEAGYVAWQSGWNVRDLWGLNDQEIAHHGYLDEGQLALLDPELIIANVPTNNMAKSSREYADLALPGWASMTDPILCFANDQGYELLGLWGQTGSFVVLARPDLADLSDLRADMAQIRLGDTLNTAEEGPLPTPTTCHG